MIQLTDRLSGRAYDYLEEVFGSSHIPELTPDFLSGFARRIREAVDGGGEVDPVEALDVAGELEQLSKTLRVEQVRSSLRIVSEPPST